MRHFRGCNLYVCFFVTSKVFLVVVSFFILLGVKLGLLVRARVQVYIR